MLQTSKASEGRMGLNIRRLLTEGRGRLRLGTMSQRVIAGVVYFVLFTAILASSVFIGRLHLSVGEPSPQLITAPWDMDIRDDDKFRQDQEEAAKSVQPVYKPDEAAANNLARDLSKAFLAIRDAATSNQDERGKINRLRQTDPFAALPEGVLSSLVKTKPDEASDVEKQANELILGLVRNVDSGARSEADVPALRDKLKLALNQSAVAPDMKVFLLAFVDAKVTQPTLAKDPELTEKLAQAKREAVQPVIHHYIANQKIIGPGEIVDKWTLHVLQQYRLLDSASPWRTAAGIALLVLIALGALGTYAYQYKPAVFASTRKLILVGLIMILVLVIGKGAVALNLGYEYNSLTGLLVPVAWATSSLAILVDAELAFLVAIILAVFTGVLADPTVGTATGLRVGIAALFGGITGVHSVSHLSQRSDLARSGLFVSAVNVATVSGLALATGMRLTSWAVAVLLAIVNGLACSVLTVGTLHWFEAGFRITSAVRLLELSNPNRPLLKRLLLEAPGTYHHSILVGNLAEAAAEAVHADATLVRVGALYHDIGKLKRPYFFIENQFAQDNPHDKIAPTLSSLIITSHVKDGLEMAREYKLPEPIQAIIAQHHGDSLVSFFYHKAKEENEDVPEEAFHYEGPRPQSKEAALVSLADSVEAAVRSFKEASPGRIEGLVRKIIKDKLNDAQLDQCDLTFQDLDRIAIAFVRVLSGIFHSRVEYPELPGGRGQNISGERQGKNNSKTESAPPVGQAPLRPEQADGPGQGEPEGSPEAND